MVNGQVVGETVQTIKCGAAVRLTPEVFEHGICMLHEDMPLFKLFLKRQEDGKLVHTFEVCTPLFPEITKFSIQVMEASNLPPLEEVADPKEEAPKSTLIMP